VPASYISNVGTCVKTELLETTPVNDLIEVQRELSRKPGLSHLLEAFQAAAALKRKLKGLTDRQIAQLVFDHVSDELNLGSPSEVILQQAIERLFASSATSAPAEGRFSIFNEAFECPRCQFDMLPIVGIEEPDYWKCTLLSCGYKIYPPVGLKGKAK
jgi:hypothetical protein